MGKIRNAAVDIGNDALKAYLGDLTHELYIPNIIAPYSNERNIVEMEKDPLDGLHVEISSGGLKSGKGTYLVGSLASTVKNNDELKPTDKKSESDQPLVLLLTALALDAVKNFPEKKGIVEATYALSTGLPLAEALEGKRGLFRDKLEKNQHEVKFLQTPQHEGKVIHIKFEDVLVNTEGSVALLDLTTNDDGSVRNEELTQMTVLINDIGGLSTDAAIIKDNGSIDNVASRGLREGVSPYLDEIMKKVSDRTGGKYTFKSRKELVDVITHESPEQRNHIYLRGNRTSIQDIVDDALFRLAREEYSFISKIWDDVPSTRVAYVIGGGGALLRPYLEKLNEQESQFPLRFVSVKESVWMIARAYFKLLLIYLSQKKTQEEVATDAE